MTSNIYREQTDAILSTLKIEDIIGEYISVKRSGRRFAAVCPFHSDKDPSLSINSDKGFWHCFGCGAGGNLITFVMKIENISFIEALRILALKAGVDFVPDPVLSAEYRQKEVLQNIVREASVFYHEKLFSSIGEEALSFLKKRGISEGTAKRFGLGYAPTGKNNLTYHLEQKGFLQEDISRSGVVSVWEDGNTKDLFRNRITIPILDHLGRFIAMGGRNLEESGPKYLNSPETAIFSKSFNLYGLNITKAAILKSSTAYLVEGYFDLISLWQHGIINVVASLGTALTTGQAQLLRKFASDIILAYDSDAAGNMAAVKNIDVFSNAGLSPRVMRLDEGFDPDSFIRKFGRDVLRARAEKSMDAFEFHIDNQMKLNPPDTPAGKSAFIKELMPIIEKMKDPVALAEYIKRISEEAGVSELLIRNLLRGRVNKADIAVFRPSDKAVSSQERILATILQYPLLVKKVSDSLSISDIEDETIRKIYELLFSMPEKEVLSAADFSVYTNDEGLLNKIMELIMSESLHVGSPETAGALTSELLQKIRDDKLKKRFEILKKEVTEALAKRQIDHSDERFVEYQRLNQYFKGRK